MKREKTGNQKAAFMKVPRISSSDFIAFPQREKNIF
jgi:hypothetical protein